MAQVLLLMNYLKNNNIEGEGNVSTQPEQG